MMKKFAVRFTDGTIENVTAWDIASAYEFAQDIYQKPIDEILKA